MKFRRNFGRQYLKLLWNDDIDFFAVYKARLSIPSPPSDFQGLPPIPKAKNERFP